MSNEFSVNLQSIDGKSPPSWALGVQKQHFWYYENEHGEQWIAKREKDVLRISGLDIDWTEIVIMLEQAVAELERVTNLYILQTLSKKPEHQNLSESYSKYVTSKKVSFREFPLAKWMLDEGELLWTASVLKAAIPVMQWERNKG